MSAPSTVTNNINSLEGRNFPEPGKEDPNYSHKYIDDVDGGYGWVICFATSLLLFSTWGLNSAYGIYYAYYLDSNYFPEATVLQYSAIGGMSFGVGLFFAPLINYVQGVLGTRITIALGGLMQFAAAFMASYAVNIWELLLTQGVLESFGLAFISLPALTLTSQWFQKKRVLANSLTVTGSGVGGIVFNLSLQRIIEVKNVNWALRTQGILSLVLVLFAAAIIKTKSKHHKVEFTIVDKDCIQCAGFWMICFYLIVCMFGYVVVMFCLSDFTVSLGYSEFQGSIVATMLQVGMVIGRPTAGFLSDYFGPLAVTAIAYYLSALFTLAMWVTAKDYATAIALGLVLGLFLGTVFSTIASITVRLVSISKLNVAFCMSWIFLGISALFSQLIGTALTTGNGKSEYRNTAIFSGVSFFAAATAILILRGYIITRDMIIEQMSEQVHELKIRVPPGRVLGNCLKWPKKRA
ncbi:probable transporter Mch2p [[Candida] railenensis]|uniref:Probable transporter Mch2p n=1 Tax=[Candida] railenensis TaxID=45579 RepID=A0A9P0QW17_9ASCO|nr:probable transporter Mch2p [[Candida] railenensis]